jgi:hypothetical protein
MSNAIGDTLPFAVAVAISPLPLIAVILILLSRRSRSNGFAFLLGWVLGLAIADGLVLALVTLLDLSPGTGPRTIVTYLKLAVGILLIVLAVRQWRARPRAGEPPRIPGWMRSIDTFTPMRAVGLGALLSTVGNLGLILAAAAGIARAQLGIRQAIGALGAFVIIGSLTVAAAVSYHFIVGAAATKMLTAWKAWLMAHNATLTTVLLLLVGVVLVGKSLNGLGMFR